MSGSLLMGGRESGTVEELTECVDGLFFPAAFDVDLFWRESHFDVLYC